MQKNHFRYGTEHFLCGSNQLPEVHPGPQEIQGSPGFSKQVVQVDNSSSLLAGPAEDVVEKMAMAQNSGT
ncbi:hypothetical protein [Methanosarcina sp. DH2]|uniref:hypothetical protein n=1 Tax=Methanosarcina sp. DH2 TaxID=2605639 RepID=UPI001E515145|nr:hypothetical protein [Methanosarcina sp. DH2]